MKPLVVPNPLLRSAILSFAILACAAETGENPNGLRIATPRAPKTISMSHEAGEVLKLVRADVADEVVMAFIKGSRTGFNLTADEIIALHNGGVADEMINEMLARKKQAPPVIVAAPQPAPQPEPAPQQTVVQQPAPTVTYVQQQPQTVYVPAPTTYVYRAPYTYYDPYPYYYRGYSAYPRVSFNFGFGHFGGYHHYGHFGHHGSFHGHFRR
ncbi:MAG TPA: hypothetical protein VM680_12060 [Verrucomicrobiae bacterium]|nr:hypothetical protein [Verrucomicrobiae bacterium]